MCVPVKTPASPLGQDGPYPQLSHPFVPQPSYSQACCLWCGYPPGSKVITITGENINPPSFSIAAPNAALHQSPRAAPFPHVLTKLLYPHLSLTSCSPGSQGGRLLSPLPHVFLEPSVALSSAKHMSKCLSAIETKRT